MSTYNVILGQLQIIGNFKEQGWNSDLYYKIKNNDMGETISIVPTSAIRYIGYMFIIVKPFFYRTFKAALYSQW